jgi:chromosome segregation ATPase
VVEVFCHVGADSWPLASRRRDPHDRRRRTAFFDHTLVLTYSNGSTGRLAILPRRRGGDRWTTRDARESAPLICLNRNHMEDRLPDSATVDQWSEQFASTLSERRDRARLLLQTERDRILRIETSLTEQIQQLSEQLELDRQEVARRDEGLERKAVELAEQAEQLARRREELEEHRRRWEARQAEAGARQETLLSDVQQRMEKIDAQRDELARREHEFAARQHALEHREKELQEQVAARDAERDSLEQERRAFAQTARQLEDQQRQLHDQAATVAAHQADLADREEHLEQQRSQLTHREQETRDQRRQIAQQLRAQRAEQLAEFERRQAELVKLAANEDLQLATQLAEATARAHQLQKELDQSREETRQREENARELQDQYDQLRGQIDHQQAVATREREDWQRELATWQQRVEQLERDAAAPAEGAELEALRQQMADATDEVQRLTAELAEARTAVDEHDFAAREALSIAHTKIEELEELQLRQEQEIAELRRQCEEAPHAAGPDPDEWQERHELLMQDLREMKAENKRLADQLAQARKAPAAHHPGPVLGFDWEAQKRRLLAELEEDGDEQDPERVQERLTIEGTIEITDQVVAAKEQEIAELRELLEQQAGNIGNLAIGAAAVAQVLDQDELIQGERENLAKLQDEWREKLRQAEMEMALERARLGRERAALEEQLRLIDQPPARQAQSRQAASPPAENEKPSRRWLARLGLRDE